MSTNFRAMVALGFFCALAMVACGTEPIQASGHDSSVGADSQQADACIPVCYYGQPCGPDKCGGTCSFEGHTCAGTCVSTKHKDPSGDWFSYQCVNPDADADAADTTDTSVDTSTPDESGDADAMTDGDLNSDSDADVSTEAGIQCPADQQIYKCADGKNCCLTAVETYVAQISKNGQYENLDTEDTITPTIALSGIQSPTFASVNWGVVKNKQDYTGKIIWSWDYPGNSVIMSETADTLHMWTGCVNGGMGETVVQIQSDQSVIVTVTAWNCDENGHFGPNKPEVYKHIP